VSKSIELAVSARRVPKVMRARNITGQIVRLKDNITATLAQSRLSILVTIEIEIDVC
jgi:hypothetical protein